MSIEPDRLVEGTVQGGEQQIDRALRPGRLDEYIGQQAVKEQMEIFIQAARGRDEPLDHTLIFGPPGLGKTTLANIIANEMGVAIKSTSGPVLERPAELAAMLTNLEAGDVLFVDEIHRLSPVVEEILYPAMEDFQTRHSDRRRPRSPLAQAGSAAIHPGRCDHPGRTADVTATGSFRHRATTRVLHGRRTQ